MINPNEGRYDKEVRNRIEKVGEPVQPSCGCSKPAGLPLFGSAAVYPVFEKMNITIDGRVIEVTPDDKNIVYVTDRAKIGIPAPCYRANRKKGCCRGCVVEVDGVQKFACITAPLNGMNIVVNRTDLREIRKRRLLKYKEGIDSGTSCTCSSCEPDV
jgi:hypothetical protein